MQLLEREHQYVALRSKGCGALTVARKLLRQLSMSGIATLLKNGSVKISCRSKEGGSSV